MRIEEIKEGDRHRKELGDLRPLAESIAAVGLLHPVVITGSGILVSGKRRIEAAKSLGWTDIPVSVAETLNDAAKLLIAEHDENRCRLDLTPLEAETIAKAREMMFAGEAKKAQQEGRKRGGKTAGKGRPKDSSRQTSAKPKEDHSKRTKRKAAAGTGYSADTLDKITEIKEAAAEDSDYASLLERLHCHGVRVDAIYKEFKRIQARKRAEADAATMAANRKRDVRLVCDIRHCSIEELFISGIKPDALITDPPYGRDAISVYGKLAEFAKDIPVVAVMCGQSYLPEIIGTMCSHLKYRWMIAYLVPGGGQVQVHQRKIEAFWKPVLLFGKADAWIGSDVISSLQPDKKFHPWGQSESGMIAIIERLTKPNQLVCDPFLGAGTTAAVCLELNRRFVGCDIDAAAIERTRRRLGIDA